MTIPQRKATLTNWRNPVIPCDYLIIGAGIAGIGLKYKLLGKTILVDKNPFRYKIGESHTPPLLALDYGLFSLIPKIERMESYTRKLGSIFCESTYGRYLTQDATPLGESYAFHSERSELERLLAKELSVTIRKEEVKEIDFERSIVTTDKNVYKVRKFIMDCSGQSKIIAQKLGLLAPIEQFKDMQAKWGYWEILQKREGKDSWAQWTVINRIAEDEWLWQIPIYNCSVLSMGIIKKGEAPSDQEFLQKAEKFSADCYTLESLYKRPAPKPYMEKIHFRANYARISNKPSGKNWILVGDAYCFADPIYSIGTGMAMSEALCVANHLNKNNGKFDHDWYEQKCRKLVGCVTAGLETWYNRKIFNDEIREEINNVLLRGGYLKEFSKPTVTDNAMRVQHKYCEIFGKATGEIFVNELPNKIYYIADVESLGIDNKEIKRFFATHLIGVRHSFCSLYLLCEKYLRNIENKVQFWKIIKKIEEQSTGVSSDQRLYHFDPEMYHYSSDGLSFGPVNNRVKLKDILLNNFLDGLKGEICFYHEIMARAREGFFKTPEQIVNLEHILDYFGKNNALGENYQFRQAQAQYV